MLVTIGRGSMMNEAAPMAEENLSKKKRRIRVKGRAPQRISRRICGDSPNETEDLDAKGWEAKSLTRRGGMGGRWYDDSCRWEYFPKNTQSHLSSNARLIHSQHVFQALNNTIGEVISEDFQDIIEENKPCNKTYQLMNMSALEKLLQENYICKCTLLSPLDEFIKYATICDNELGERLLEARKRWAMKCEISTELKLKVKNIGLHANLSIHCDSCGKCASATSEKTKYEGTSYNGKQYKTQNCSWYTQNIKVVLATLATGLGPSDLPSFFSFLGLPNLFSFSRQQYYKIENLIGQHIREVAEASMKEAMKEECELTKKDKINISKNNNSHDNKF